MRSSDNQPLESALASAAVFGGLGVIVLVRSVYAQLTGGIIAPARVGTSWMIPGQGYLPSGLLFLVAGYALFLPYRRRSGKDDGAS